jgi:tRNA-dihydrouridine synthase
MKNFWTELPKPLFVLAPLANVTDAAFRSIIAKYSKPQGPAVFYTEFVSADGLALANPLGRAKLMRDLVFSEAERPIVAQFFTSTPAHMEAAAKLAAELGFDGVDIKSPAVARELIRAAKRGAPNLPVSVKTRLGYNKDTLEEWLPELLAEEPAALVLHARTRKEMSAVPARWERVKRAVEIRNEMGSKTLILGNGDLTDIADAEQKVKETGADGAMLGRAIFGKPWLFALDQNSFMKNPGGDAPNSQSELGDKDFSEKDSVSARLRVAVEHAKLFETLLGDIKNFAIMKKHFKAYSEGFPGAKELRVQLMETNTTAEIEAIIETFLKTQ